MTNWKMNKKMLAACLAATMLAAGGCSGGIPIVSEVRETSGYTNPQTMILIATEKNRYRNVYTDQIWQVQVDQDGTTFQTYLLGEVKDFLRELKTMNLLADEEGIGLSTQEKEKLSELAALYYDSLTAEDLEYMGVEESDVYTMYEAYHRANKLVDELTKDVNLEISDSEAKIITVEEIKLSSLEQAQEVYAQVMAEGADFASIAKTHSEDSEIEKQVGRSERQKGYEDAVFSLGIGEISPIIEEEGAYYLVRCVSDYDEAATLERKKQLSLYRKNQAFRQIYDAFAAEHPVEIQGSIWEEVSFTSDDQSTAAGFFELYQEEMNP